MAGWSWGPVLLRLAKLAETGAAIKLLTGWTTATEFGSAVLKVAAVRVSAIALENLVEWTTGGPGITLPWDIDQDWGLAASDFDTDVLVVGICAGLLGVIGLLCDRLMLPMSSPQTTPSAPAAGEAAEAAAAAAAASFPLNAPDLDQSGLYGCIVDRLQLRPEASEAGVCNYDIDSAIPMATPDVVRQGEQVLICGAVTIASSGKVYLRRLDGAGYYPADALRWKAPLPRPALETDWTNRPAVTAALPGLPAGTMMLGERALRLRQWVSAAEATLRGARDDVEQRCLAVHAEHQQVIDNCRAAQKAEIDKICAKFQTLVKREEDSRDEAIAVAQHARRRLIDESKRTVARVAQEAAEAERAGTFMGWLSPAKLSYAAPARATAASAGAPGVAAASPGIPDEFKCSISREIMEEPVITACGHTFERRQLEKWLSKNTNCPECRSAVRPPLIPNLNLRNAIRKLNQTQSALPPRQK